MMEKSSLVGDVIDYAWTRINNNFSSDHINVSQISSLAREIETALEAKKPILNEEEAQLLRTMVLEKPLLKVYKHEIIPFLTKLVHSEDFENFLCVRVGKSRYAVESIMERKKEKAPQFSKTRDDYSFGLNGPSIDSLKASKPIGFEGPIQDNHIFSPSYSPAPVRSPDRKELNRLRGELRMKEEEIVQREEEYSFVSRENRKALHDKKELEKKIILLENEVTNNRLYTEDLEKQLEDRYLSQTPKDMDTQVLRNLAQKNAENQRSIKHLETICDQQRMELEKRDNRDKNYRDAISNLVREMNKQDIIMEKVKKNLKLEEFRSDNKTLQSYFYNMPFIKQYYFFFKYRQDQANKEIFMTNLVTLILTTFIILNFIRAVFYIILTILGGSGNTNQFDAYIYENSNSWFGSNDFSFVWWKEIGWIEYMVYSLSEWMSK